MSTLPTFSHLINNKFAETWFRIREKTIDNILLATPVTAALKMAGVMTEQVGGHYIVGDTVRYASGPTVSSFGEGDTFDASEIQTETVPRWSWGRKGVGIMRTFVRDQVNSGADMVKDYIQKRINEARDAMVQDIETGLYTAQNTTETGDTPLGLNDILAPTATKTSGTFGGLARSNSWWVSKYKAATATGVISLESDMRNLYNTISENREPPNLIITTQTVFELYEEIGENKSQIQLVKDATGRLLDLGFETQRFKGKPMIYSPNVTSGVMQFFNTNFINWFYDPRYWFAFTGWKEIPNSLDLRGQIIRVEQFTSNQLRRHGELSGIA